MSSLSILNESVGNIPSAASSPAFSCSPAVAVLLIGTIIVMIDIVNRNVDRVGFHLLVTFGATITVLLLCLLGFTHIGTMMVLFPLVILVGIVVIIILALMIGSPVEPEPQPEPEPVPEPPTKKTDDLSSAYKYVMTGKQFGLF